MCIVHLNFGRICLNSDITIASTGVDVGVVVVVVVGVDAPSTVKQLIVLARIFDALVAGIFHLADQR